MATFNIEELENGTVYDQDGTKVGSVAQLYLDDASGEPNWVTVNTGLFGSNETFVPLDQARVSNGEIHVPYTKDFIKDAPNLDADAHIDENQEDDLYRYYGLNGGTNEVGRTGDREGHGNAAAAGTAGAAGAAGGLAGDRQDRDVNDDRDALGHDAGSNRGQYPDERGEYTREGDEGQYGLEGTPRENRDANLGEDDVDGGADLTGTHGAPAHGDVHGDGTRADETRGVEGDGNSVVRHEEQVNVGTERVQTGRARLRKRVVTEQETVTVPVEREEVEVVREPVGEGQARDGGSLGEEDLEVTLTEERPVVDKEVVAKERVGLDKNVVQDQERVQTEVGREEVEVVNDGDADGRNGVDGRNDRR